MSHTIALVGLDIASYHAALGRPVMSSEDSEAVPAQSGQAGAALDALEQEIAQEELAFSAVSTRPKFL